MKAAAALCELQTARGMLGNARRERKILCRLQMIFFRGTGILGSLGGAARVGAR